MYRDLRDLAFNCGYLERPAFQWVHCSRVTLLENGPLFWHALDLMADRQTNSFSSVHLD